MKLEAFQCPICFSTQLKKEGDTYQCLSCGNVYTKRQADSQMFIDLRIANSFRQFAEFSKAKTMYEEIIAKYPDDDLSPAYWGLVLCDQHVLIETDNNGRLFPTFYRIKEQEINTTASYKRFYNYVMKNSREKLKIYAERLNIIENARKQAVVIKETTKPYDVFICFKKTHLDSDMVTNEYDLANEIYNGISDKYKVFYSEKSLKGIRIREYEPNIYYGLHTAKVMILICSKKEFLESHWMKNEWKRFLEINKNSPVGSKCIIPVFMGNFTPDDLPTELAHLQGLKYGISLSEDIKRELDSIINPIDKDAEQQKQINSNTQAIEKLARMINEKQVQRPIEFDAKIESLIKLIEVQIEDLGNYEEASNLVDRLQRYDAQNYMSWYFRLLIEFQANSKMNLVMHSNFKESVNYRLLKKYAKSASGIDFVDSLDETRNKYLMKTAEVVNKKLEELDNNKRPTEEDINNLRMFYESLDIEARKYVKDLKRIVSGAYQKIKDNKVGDFNSMLKKVQNKEHPNYNDIIEIKDSFAALSDEEKVKVENYKEVIVETSNKMKQNKVQIVQQALYNLDQQDLPQREDIIKTEKKYNALEDEYKQYIKDFNEIMTRAYDKKYRNDAKVLNEYLTKLPREKVANRDLFIKFENRYRALPKKYRALVTNIGYLDNYYDLLMAQEGKSVQQEPKIKKEKIKEPEEKKKGWFWNKG